MAVPQTTVQRQTWTIDPAHTVAEFSVKHMMITTVKGVFAGVEGVVRTAVEDTEGWEVEVRIDAATLDTRVAQRDEHLRSEDFFDVANHPHITFRSKRIDREFDEAGDRFEIVGDLTIRGTTREVVLDATFEGEGRDPWGGERMSFSAKTKIDRREFGLVWNQALETGGVLVGNDVRIELDVQLVRQDES